MVRRSATLLTMAILGFAAVPSFSTYAQATDLGCTMIFSLTDWSVIHRRAQGTGLISCKNGASKHVIISAVGAGTIVGKFEIENGTGTFTHVRTIDDVVGDYVAAKTDVVKSGTVQLLTKGTVSLALADAREGISLGVDLRKFIIKARSYQLLLDKRQLSGPSR